MIDNLRRAVFNARPLVIEGTDDDFEHLCERMASIGWFNLQERRPENGQKIYVRIKNISFAVNFLSDENDICLVTIDRVPLTERTSSILDNVELKDIFWSPAAFSVKP